MTKPQAVVMNMFYTGIGIARNLGEMGVPVIGLGPDRFTWGNFSRFCKFLRCPDSRDQQNELVEFLVRLGKKLETRAVIFPTRDYDVMFLSQHREDLSDYFIVSVPKPVILDNIMNKWRMLETASRCDISVPRSFLIESKDDLNRMPRINFPCVLKPVYSSSWRAEGAWQAVGGRKAIGVSSFDNLYTEYERVSAVPGKLLVQELVPGGDDQIYVLGSYLSAASEPLAYFTGRKLVQMPPQFGTGCLVESVRLEELELSTFRFLKVLGYYGISEVEYKKDPNDGTFKLIEINPRHWDWHRLGTKCGANLSYIAYRDLTGESIERSYVGSVAGVKWIAEQEFFLFVVQGFKDGLTWRRIRELAKGGGEYGSFSWGDPLPFLIYLLQFLTFLFAVLKRRLLRAFHAW